MKRHSHQGRYLSKTKRGKYAWKRRPVHNHIGRKQVPYNRFSKRYTDSEGVKWQTNEFGYDVIVDEPTSSRQADRAERQADLDMGIAEQIRAAKTRDDLMHIPDIKETVSDRQEQSALMDIYRQQLDKVMGKSTAQRESEPIGAKVSTEEQEFSPGRNRLSYIYTTPKEHPENIFLRRKKRRRR